MSNRICIDGHNLALQNGTGVATYARNLANNISALKLDAWTVYGAPIPEHSPNLLQEVLFYDYLGGQRSNNAGIGAAFRAVKEAARAPFGKRAFPVNISGLIESRRFDNRLPDSARIFNSTNLFNAARAYFKTYNRFLELKFDNPPDVMHWTYPLPVKVCGVPNIYTIHDLVPLILPYTTLDNKKYYFRLIKKCIENAEKICTVSERSRSDIINLFGTNPSSVVNTYQSVSVPAASRSKSDNEVHDEIRGVYGLEPKSYFLFFGAIEPKKNVGRLIEAFLSTKLNATLVIAGNMAWKAEEELKLYDNAMKQKPKAPRIKLVGYASSALLISLIRGSKAVVFPSLYEGFGLPVLEAMQLGVPTLCSGEGSLHEIAGDASRIVNAYDIASISAGLKDLDASESLRSELVMRGFRQAELFSEARYRSALSQLYNF